MTYNLWYELTGADNPSHRDEIRDAAERLAPSGGRLTTCLVSEDGTGEIAYVMSGDYLSLDDEELCGFLEERCDYAKRDDAEDSAEE